MSLYDTLIKKLSDTVYGKRLSAQIGTLTEGRVKFKELSLEEQALVLLQILNLFRCNNENADLKAIGGPGRAGVLGMNKSIDKISQISIIHQSPTGIFEQEIDLLSL